MINAIMNMNKVIIQNVDLSLNIEKFSKEYTKIYVISLIGFFFEYDQVILIEKSQNLTAFMTFLNLLRII